MKRILVSSCLLGVNCRYNGVVKADEAVLRLLNRSDLQLIPVCPEQLGGLPTPRVPSERRGNQVCNQAGMDVTEQYRRGAEETCKLAQLFQAEFAILKERSPSCGKGKIYDGTFSGTLIDGNGVTAELLMEQGILVMGESEIGEF